MEREREIMHLVNSMHAKSHGSGSSSGSATIKLDLGSNFPIRF